MSQIQPTQKHLELGVKLANEMARCKGIAPALVYAHAFAEFHSELIQYSRLQFRTEIAATILATILPADQAEAETNAARAMMQADALLKAESEAAQ